MTVPSTPRQAGPFYGTGALVSYPFSFKTFSTEDLRVAIANASGVETIGVLDSDYLVTLNPDQDATPGGSINYAVGGVATALPVGYTLAVDSQNMAFTQEADLPQGGNFSSVRIEDALDRVVAMSQILKAATDRSVRMPLTDGVVAELPTAALRALKSLTFDAVGNVTVSTPAAGTADALAAALLATSGTNAVGYISDASGAFYRRLQDKIRENRVSILDFATAGTLGNGQNATAALQAAVAYANAGYLNNNFKHQIFLPAGDYVLSRVELNSMRGITFVGENTMDATKRKTRIIFAGPSGQDAMLLIRSCAFLHFKGIHFELATDNTQHLIKFTANDAAIAAPLNRFSNVWIGFEDCVFQQTGSPGTPALSLVWVKSCSDVQFLRCAFRPGSSVVALKIGADTDVDPDNGQPTYANGIAAITILDQCYIWGDIERQKSYGLRIVNSQFAVHDADTGNSRLTISGLAATFHEEIENNIWDPTGISSYAGTLIEGGTSAETRGLRVVGNQLTGRLTLVQVNRGDAVITGNRPIAYGGSTSNVCVRIGANAGNVRVGENNEPGYIVDTTVGTVRARLVIDDRASKFGPVIAASEVPNAVTLPAAAAFQSIRSQSHQFAGGWVRFTYSITIQHKDGGNTRAYTSRLTIGGTLVAGSVRRASATVLDEYIVLSMSHIVYVDATDQALTISLEVQQGSGAANFGIVSGADTPARSTWLVELMTH